MWYFWLAAIVLVLYYVGKTQNPRQSDKAKSASKNLATRPITSRSGEDDDTFEGWFYDAPGPQRSAAKTVRMKYSDANQRETERVVNIRAFEANGPSGLVFGHCHLRNDARTFRFDRMRRVVDEETGEIIPDLQKQLNEEWLTSPQAVMDQLYEQHHDVMKMMLFMAKADGSVRAAELDVIAKYCVEVTQDNRITLSMIKDRLKCVDVVSITTFVRTYNRLRRERPDAALLAAAACRAIVATQKTVHPNEQEALNALDKPLPTLK